MIRYIRDALIFLAALALIVFSALVAVSCASPVGQPPLEQRVVAAMETGWASAGLPDIPDGRRTGCHLDLFAVEFPTATEFDLRCYPATTATAHACFRERLLHHQAMSLYSRSYPTAQISPSEPPETAEGLAVHELAHWLCRCVLGYWDYDYDHSDTRVWRPYAGSAEDVARAELRAQ